MSNEIESHTLLAEGFSFKGARTRRRSARLGKAPKFGPPGLLKKPDETKKQRKQSINNKRKSTENVCKRKKLENQISKRNKNK